MKCTLAVAVGLLTLAGPITLEAQGPAPAQGAAAAAAAEIRGAVVEGETSAPVARASVAVRTKTGVLITGAIANDKGAFALQGLRPGTYSMRITALGFSPKLQEVTIADPSQKLALPPVKLTRVAVALQGVTSTAERDAMAVEVDRNTYRAKDVAPAATNASEVLENVPSVQVDADGKVSYRGNENVVVQINGRPTPMRGQQLATYLKSLPASVLERVEVIPNPSAKYDPEGMAGILNILLKQQVDLGLSAGLNVAAANQDRYNGSGNIGYQAGPWTSMLTVGHNTDERDQWGINDRQRLRSGQTLSFTDQDLAGRQGNRGTNINGNVEYKLNAKDAISATGSFGARSMKDASLTAYQELDANRAVLDLYDRDRDTRLSGTFFDGSAGFRRTWDQKLKHELYSEVRFTQNDDVDKTSLFRTPTSATSISRADGELDHTDMKMQQVVGQVDYTKVWQSKRKIEAGYKGNLRFLDRDYTVTKDSLGTGNWIRSPLSNAFSFDENVQAVYGVFTTPLAKKVDVTGGVRAEYATRDFTVGSSRNPYDYASLYPSGAVMYNYSDAVQYKASYSRRVRRPGTQELNPFPVFFDAQNVFLGNPNLAPEYTDAIELGATRNGKYGTLQFQPFYRATHNSIQVNINTDGVVDGRSVTTVSFANFKTSNSWGSDLNGNLRLGPKLSAFGGFNVSKVVTDGGSTSALSTNTVMWMARTNVTSNISKNTTLQGAYMYRSAMNIPGGRFSPMQMTNFVLRQKLNGDKASVALRVIDPFKMQKFEVKAGDANLVQLTQRAMGVRGVFLSYQYAYGRPPKIRQRQDDQPQQSGPGFP